MSEKLYLYPIWIRVWHILNAIVFLILIVTGLSIQYVSADSQFINFNTAIVLHNFCGVALTILYVYFLAANIFTKNRKYYRIPDNIFGKLRIQLDYYFRGMFKKEPLPYPIIEERKFNPLQLMTYVLTMYIGMPILLLTGWGLLYPEITVDVIFGNSGLFVTDILHIVMGFFMSLYLIIHIYFASISKVPGANFRAIINGYHEH